MKTKILLFLSLAIVSTACNKKYNKQLDEPHKAVEVRHGLRFCEGTVPYQQSVLVSNFGTENLFPLNKEGKGYIVKLQNGKVTPFIHADGILNAPKGMAIKKDHLFIADVEQVVVYNMRDLTKSPQIIAMPPGNFFVNDIVTDDKNAYISVTDAGKIYSLDLSQIDNLSSVPLKEFASVVGANGLVLDGKKMYVASYPVDNMTHADNVIYIIPDINQPKPERFIERTGQYDGLAMHRGLLFFTDWDGGKVGYIDLKTKEIEYMTIEGMPLVGAADISINNDSLYIPMLTTSEVLIVEF